MKLHPPNLAIDDNDPFKDQLFGRKEFAESLTSLLRKIDDGLVIFVNAPWGEGKTTFARMWRGHLRNQKLNSIYYDAYAADYFDDPFVSFSGEILNLIDTDIAKDERGIKTRKEFKKTAVEVGKRLTGIGFKTLIRAATMGAMGAPEAEELKDLATGVSEIGADIIEKKIENYSAEKDALAAFKKSLAKVAAAYRAKHDFPLTIIVDELDRCRPDFALGLLERIKHFFDVDNVAFVLLVNQEQIERYIRSVYGDVDARGYLLKFATIFVDLPVEKLLHQHVKDHRDYCRILFDHHGVLKGARNHGDLPSFIECFVGHLDLTLREVEKVFGAMTLYYSSSPRSLNLPDFLIPMLFVLKVKKPTLYQNLGEQRVSVKDFFTETGLDCIAQENLSNVDQDWITTVLKCCLMSASEFDEAANKSLPGDQTSYRMRQTGSSLGGHERCKIIIPQLCKLLNRFSFVQALDS